MKTFNYTRANNTEEALLVVNIVISNKNETLIAAQRLVIVGMLCLKLN
ncbi:MAG: hypothetical protein AAF298_27535 [Cyanobacteria bacterium P01_A01_bin.40]